MDIHKETINLVGAIGVGHHNFLYGVFGGTNE